MSLAAVEAERRGFAVRVAALFAGIFCVTGSSLPYLPIWLDWVGLTAREIAIISACPLFVRVLVSPTIAFLADHRRYLIVLAWLALMSQLLLAQTRGFWPILLASLLLALAWTSIMPLAETIAIGGMRSLRLDYGRARLWGSVSFTAATLAGGWLMAHADPPSLFALLVAGSTLLLLAAHALPGAPARVGE